MILHTLNAPPDSTAFRQCVGLLVPGDALLLLGDGVYGAIVGSEARAKLDAAGIELHILQADAQAAGVHTQLGDASTVDMDGFVALSERFARQLAWY